MLGGLGPLVWAPVRSWLTPAALFVLLNLVIGTIAITSNGFRSRHQRKLSRAPSVLDRLRSVGLYRYGYPSGDAVPLELSSAPPSSHEEEFSTQRDEPPVLTRAPSFLERLRSIGLYRYPSGDAVPLELSSAPPSSHEEVLSTQLDKPPVLSRAPSVLERLRSIGLYRYRSGEVPPEHEEQHRFGRSQSEPRAKAEVEEEAKRAARVKKSASAKPARVVRAAAEEEVDERADDFINRFKQQLRLQRLDSIMNYKEMLNRGR